MKLDVKKTFLLGLGFFAVSLVWPLYNVYVPIFLRDFLDSQFQINAIMTLDNLLAVSLIPFIASLSDRTNTRFGRRMPFLMIGIPISAIAFVFLPNYTSFLTFMIIITVLNFSMAIFRAPTVALMPDITPAPLRSKANGIINFMGGLASVFVLIGGSFLYKANKNYPFVFTALMMFFALGMLLKYIKEPNIGEKAAEERIGIIKSVKEIIHDHDKSTLFILFAIFFWFFGYQGIEATFSNYCVQLLGLEVSDASLILGFFALSFLAFAIPAGFIGTKIGKRKAILIGLIGDATIFILLSFIGTVIPFNQLLMMFLMAVGGFFWALININSYPMIVERTSEEKIGTFTGLYYFSSSLAAIFGPLFLGAFVDLIGFSISFWFTSLAYLIAFVFIKNTKILQTS
ncbi:MFS transporter [Fusibacter bizertensis]|jgi:Na+/melibiose symporter and related transporters|uniref:MFS transporter n=1 Tax=Fusibacter bizertensis TaxID=1488331 RepID=A0ABT6ND16_9FIRM|nr:MFS transporter [Fusibacter bizertensis]MDH8678301.1 MFS transporter [Fusibacter bizertensis]